MIVEWRCAAGVAGVVVEDILCEDEELTESPPDAIPQLDPAT
jgi:hypothetical protein